ncbi:DNA alkylation repair protein [Ferruginibacter sp. SUN106]|uniref:DNA alkylation repair protein n=1 Tax=Ferruginibacter sp. SUN106 TaxID=2978348 RepID=UPI003D35E9A0
MSNELKAIQKILRNKSLPEALAAFKKFVPGNMKIYGVRTPVLNELSKQFKPGGFELIKTLWDAGALEEKLLAVKILQQIARQDAEQSLQLVQYFAPGIDNWAVCDAIGMQALQTITKTHAAAIFALAKKYNRSSNLWERRLSLVLVEWYTRDKTYHEAIKKLIAPLENDSEYYVKKAVVWINKNFAKNK